MPKIDETRPFITVRIAVLTVSDTPADDKSGDTLAAMIVADGHQLAARSLVKTTSRRSARRCRHGSPTRVSTW
jgi:molybdenum cofactor biosynthesis protein B